MLWMDGLGSDSINDLHHLGICMGQKGTLSAVDKIRVCYDRNVKIWKEQIEVNFNIFN